MERTLRSGHRRRAATLMTTALALGLVSFVSPVAADPSPPYIPPDAPWLTTVNYYRAIAGVPAVVEDPNMSAGAQAHSCYMLFNGIAHDELPNKPGYTPEGDLAGNSGNVAVSSAFGSSARSHIELWMTGPFHAIGVLRPGLTTVGFGKCDNQATSPWRSGATLDVLRGLGAAPPMTQPIVFPGNGTTTNLDRFIVETPDPLSFCGWTGGAGLPLIAMMPEAVNSNVTASITGPSGPLQTCAISRLNSSGTAQAILQGENAVIAIPRNPLAPGTYTATVTTQSRTVTWSFTVDPAAANGTILPAPTASPSGPAVRFQPLPPARIVDTRENLGATSLLAGVTKRIQVTGSGGVPGGAAAMSGNFTVVGTPAAGFLTVWNCSATRPTVSTVNYLAADVAPNASTVPLDASGGVCVYSNTSIDLVIDVNGYYSATSATRFTPITPVRLMDTREGLGAGRLGAGQSVQLQVGGVGGIPSGVAAVTLNVTSTDASTAGYVTVYACDGPVPTVSNLNPQFGRSRPNLVMTPVSSGGRVCLFSLGETELIVDATGYLSGSSTRLFTPSTPFRMVDTRDAMRPEMNFGTQGAVVHAGQTLVVQVAGNRGVPANATAVSMNLTIVGANNPGYITAWPCGDRPATSTANYEIAEAISNGAQLPLSSSGALCVFSQRDAHVIVDINGWWS
jgi:Cysteine-rich secretory protein family